MSDVGRVPAPKTVMLREWVWRIEISRTKAIRFFDRNKRWIFAALGVIGIGMFLRYFLVGFASTADFYPASCLGSWENVANALGKPDLLPGAPRSSFNGVNSAYFSTSTAQMFCGNFRGETDLATLESKSLEDASLVLSWTFVFPDASPPAPVSAAPVSSPDTGSAATTSPDAASSSASATPSMEPTVSSTPPIEIAPSSTQAGSDTSSTMSSEPATSSAPSDTSTDILPPPSPVPAATSSDSATPPPDTTTPAGLPTSQRINFLNIAYADELSPADASSSQPLIPAPTSTQISTSTDNATASDTTSIIAPTPTSTKAITIDTSMFQNIIIPSSSADDILSIVYSTDGTNWLPVVNINKDNWQTQRFALPIHSWAELEHLQVAFVGLGGADAPGIYLDGVTVEADYMDTPEGTTTVAPASEPVNPDSQSAPPVPTPDETQAPPPVPPDGGFVQQSTVPATDVYDQGAHQECSVSPFSQDISAGSGADFLLTLLSGLRTSSTAPSAAASSSAPQQYQHPVYETHLGSLPGGVYASITDGSASDVSSTKSIYFSTTHGATQGSYSLLVVYRERQDDASMRSTACQLNLVIH